MATSQCIHRSIHLEHGALCRRGPRLVLCEAAPAKSVEVQDHLVWDLSHAQTSWEHKFSLHVGMDTVTPSNVVRDLGVLLNSELTMRQHISKINGVCFIHLWCLMKVRRILGSSVTCRLVTAFVASRLDYCNALLAGLSQSTITPLQRIENAAVRLVSGLRPRDHVTSSLHELHWLPIRYRIIFKLCLMLHNAHVGRSPRYIIDTLSRRANMANRGQHRSSASSKYELPALHLKIGEWAFSYSGPAFWNSLPSEMTSIRDTQTVKSRMKTHVFRLTYDC